MSKMTNETMNEILSVRLLEGKSVEETAKICGVSKASAHTVTKAFELCRAEDFDTLEARILSDANFTRSVVGFALQKTRKTAPASLWNAFDERDKRLKKAADQRKKAADPAPEPAPVPVKKQEPIEDVNEKVFFIRVLEETMKMNELLTQLMDVVIPKYTGDLKDCFGINTDLITEKLEKCERRLEKIEYQTRKRGM